MTNNNPDRHHIIQEANDFANLLNSYKTSIERYNSLGTDSIQAWLLLVGPAIGSLHNALNNFEHDFIIAAIDADIAPQTLAEHLGYNPTTMYRRINRIKEEPPKPETKPKLRATRLEKPAAQTPQAPAAGTWGAPSKANSLVDVDTPNTMHPTPNTLPHSEEQLEDWRKQVREPQQ